MHLPFFTRRDPYWGLDGRAARGNRRRRHIVASIVVMLCAGILALTLARLASIDGAALLRGPNSLLVAASLGADAVACCLIFAGDARRRDALQAFGELTGTLA